MCSCANVRQRHILWRVCHTPVDGSLVMATAEEDAGCGAASNLQQNKRNIKAPHKTLANNSYAKPRALSMRAFVHAYIHICIRMRKCICMCVHAKALAKRTASGEQRTVGRFNAAGWVGVLAWSEHITKLVFASFQRGVPESVKHRASMRLS